MIKKQILFLFICIAFRYTAFSQVNLDQSDEDFQIDAYGGGIRNSFPTAINGRYDSYQVDPAFSPGFGVNFLYTIPAKVELFKFGLSLGYNGYSANFSKTGANDYSSGNIHYTTSYNENIILKNSILATNLYAMFVVNPKSKTQFYAKIGLNTNFSLGAKWVSSESSSATDGMSGSSPIHSTGQSSDKLAKVKQVFLALQTGAGVAIGRSKIEFCYWPSTNIADDNLPTYSTMQKTFNLTSMGVFYYYRFTD
jgi:hypothetical protein